MPTGFVGCFVFCVPARLPCGALCWVLAMRYMRTPSGRRISFPRPSVWASDPRFCQYSVEVWMWTTSGSVAGRLSMPSRLPV